MVPPEGQGTFSFYHRIEKPRERFRKRKCNVSLLFPGTFFLIIATQGPLQRAFPSQFYNGILLRLCKQSKQRRGVGSIDIPKKSLTN